MSATQEGQSRLRVGVIGAGGIARSVHLPSLAEMNDVEVAAVCDIIESRAAEAARQHGIARVYTLYKEMLSRETLDAVFVLVEPGNLFHVTAFCLQAGLDVFMEKPPGVTLYQAESLARQADAAGRICQVGFNRRHIRLVQEVKRIFEAHGAVNHVRGCFFKYGSGAFDAGSLGAFESDVIHAVDLVRWFAGSEPAAAATVTGRTDEPLVNRWSAVMRFENAATAVIEGNYRTGGRVHRFEVHSAGLSAYIDLGFGPPACSAVLLGHEGPARYSVAARGEADEHVARLDGLELAGSREFHRYYGFWEEDRHFLDCLRSRQQPATSIHDAVESMRLAEMITSRVV